MSVEIVQVHTMERNNLGNNSKICGYLEKKGKRKMIGCYKKYWFVLEGGLLLYYRSKADYETISPCKGSINLGPPCYIKPCASTSGVFQIQTRLAAVTLRAENREEQNRWMQALMSEINPNKNQQRLSHFRYSMDDLQRKEAVVETVKQMPQKLEEKNENSNDIIQRLQKMGAQSCIPQGMTNKRAERKTTSQDIEYTEYENCIQSRDSNRKSQNGNQTDHIYQGIAEEFVDNNIYSVPDNHVCEKKKKSMTLPIKSQGKAFNSLRIKSLNDANRPITFILENDAYSVSIHQKTIDDSASKIGPRILKTREKSFVLENEHYARSNPRRDHNENEVTAESSEEHGYAEINENFKTDLTYEKPDVEYANPIFSNLEAEDTRLRGRKHEEKKKVKARSEKNGSKLVKRPSFLRRVWKKKDKHKAKETVEDGDDDEDIYETVPTVLVEKLAAVNDGTAIQMLAELQSILENKMPILIRQISNEVGSPTHSSKSETSSNNKTESHIDNDLYCNIDDLQEIHSPPVPPKSRNLETPHPFDDPLVDPTELPTKKKSSDAFKSIEEILHDLDGERANNASDDHNKVKRLIQRFSVDGEHKYSEVVLRDGRKSHVYRDDIESDELSRLLEELAKVASAPILMPGVTTSLDVSNLEDLELKKLLPGRRRRFSEPDYDVPRPHKSLTILPKTEYTSEAIIGSTRFFGPILKPSDMVAFNNNSHNGDSSRAPSRLNSMTPDSLEASPTPPSKIDEDQRRETEVIEEEPFYSSHMYYKFVDKKSFNESRLLESCPSNLQGPRQAGFMVENDIYNEVRCSHKADRHNKITGVQSESEEFNDSLEICKDEAFTGF